jgi:hypothetical protein
MNCLKGMIGQGTLKMMNSLSKQEFEKYREIWKSEWYDHWRLLDIDFEVYMLMKGLTKQEYKNLNSEIWQNT